jgi:hypothetical protein
LTAATAALTTATGWRVLKSCRQHRNAAKTQQYPQYN